MGILPKFQNHNTGKKKKNFQQEHNRKLHINSMLEKYM